MYIIVGLGNPGKEYEKTRHNAGFLALDYLKNEWKFDNWNIKKDFKADISNREINGKKIIICKPTTFMNKSGESVQSIANFYKVPVENIIVVYDDLDLTEVGDIKWRQSKETGSGGHNGIKDIVEKLGDKNFPRVKIGISGKDRPTQMEGRDYVLSKFTDEELEKLKGSFELISQKILDYISK